MRIQACLWWHLWRSCAGFGNRACPLCKVGVSTGALEAAFLGRAFGFIDKSGTQIYSLTVGEVLQKHTVSVGILMGAVLITRTVRNHHICGDHPPQRPAPQKWPRLCWVARNPFFASSIFNLTNRPTDLPDYVIGLSHYANAGPESRLWFYLSSMIAPWKILYRLYARSVNNKHIMHIIAIAIPSSSYSKSSQNIRSPNYKVFTNPAPSARPILSINFSEIFRTQSVIWLKEHAKPKRNARSSAQWMNHTQRALSWSPSGECTPTHKPHCRVQDDGGTTSLASSPGKTDAHDW